MVKTTIYDELDTIVQSVLKKLSTSDKVIRLIGIDTPDALSASTVPSFNSLQMKRWFPLPKNVTEYNKTGTYLMVYYAQSVPSGGDRNNVYNDDVYFALTFFSHESTWILNPENGDYKFRPYQLLSECKKLLNDTAVPEAYRQKFIVYPPTIIKPSSDFIGYEIKFKITGCGK